jgi:enolase
MPNLQIAEVRGFQVFDSRGWPTLAVAMRLGSGALGFAQVPAGASKGSREARELRDGGRAFDGRGVSRAIAAIEEVIAPALRRLDDASQERVDQALIALDGTTDKSRLGANTLLGVSLAFAQAAAHSLDLPLYRYWRTAAEPAVLPTPQFNVINGGQHADSGIPIQEFLLIPGGAASFAEAVAMGTEVYHALGGMLRRAGYRTAVGDEGGYAPSMASVEAVFDLLLASMAVAGIVAGDDMCLGLDVAATALVRPDGHYQWGDRLLSSDEMIAMYEGWCRQYPIVSLEDGLSEDDWKGWTSMTRRLGEHCQIVGDDIFVTQVPYLTRGIEESTANSALVKLNQVGTVSETQTFVRAAHKVGWTTVVSHRSGETTDTTMADFAVAVGASQMKAGAPARGERLAKYNHLLLLSAHDADMGYAGWPSISEDR